MLRTMSNLLSIETGFTPDQVVTATMQLPDRYDAARRRVFVPPVIDRLKAAPGITNAAFRRLCREHGGGLYVAEMVTSHALVERTPESLRIIAHDPDETPRSVQVYGVDPATIGGFASALPDAEHVLPFPRPGGKKLFPSHRIPGWHRPGGVPVSVQVLAAGAILGGLVAAGLGRRLGG